MLNVEKFRTKYRILEDQQIAKGYHAYVNKAECSTDKKIYACKRREKAALGNQQNPDLLLEVRVLQAASKASNGVVQLKDYFHDTRNDDLYIFMEYDQQSIRLSKYIKNYVNTSESNNENLFKQIMRQVVETMKKCHRKDLVHGNLTKKTILVNPLTKKVKICGFGKGNFIKGRTSSHASITAIKKDVDNCLRICKDFIKAVKSVGQKSIPKKSLSNRCQIFHNLCKNPATSTRPLKTMEDILQTTFFRHRGH